MANQHPAFRKNTLADWLRLWCHLVYLGGIMAPPSVMWHLPDLKSGAKIRWQGLLSQFCDVYHSLHVWKQLYSGANSPHTQKPAVPSKQSDRASHFQTKTTSYTLYLST